MFAWLFVGLFVLIATLTAHAQTAVAPAATTGISPDGIVQWLTPILVPLLIAGFKKVSPSLPGWCLPILAPLLGMLLELVNSLATTHTSNFAVAAALGLAGVGLREVKDQLTPAKAPGS